MTEKNSPVQEREVREIPYFSPTMNINNLTSVLNAVTGRVLTVSEAVVEPQKIKATKKLLKDAIWKDFLEIERWHSANVGNDEHSTFPIFDRGAVEED